MQNSVGCTTCFSNRNSSRNMNNTFDEFCDLNHIEWLNEADDRRILHVLKVSQNVLSSDRKNSKLCLTNNQ